MTKPSSLGDLELVKTVHDVDPLRGRVETELRNDLGKSRKHDGSVTFVAMPSRWQTIETFPYYRPVNSPEIQLHTHFHKYIQSLGIYTLLYNVETLNAVERVHAAAPLDLVSISTELMPSTSNTRLGKFHGTQGAYVRGCRETLCRVANRIAQRERYGRDAYIPPEQLALEDDITQIFISYMAYMEYIRQIRSHRKQLRGTDKKSVLLRRLTTAQTVIIDCTNESFFLHDLPAWDYILKHTPSLRPIP